MRTTMRSVLAATFCVFLLGASADVPQPPRLPSASLGIEVDVKPEGTPGRFLVSSIVTDLENNAVIARPRLVIAADKPARIQTGAEGLWLLQISVSADGALRKAAYDATFERQGKLVSRQRVTVNLDG
jgi:hypothetical protein